MPARLILFTDPILLTGENTKLFLAALEDQQIPESFPFTEQTFDPGTYELPIPSSTNYTLTIGADGRGMLQRTMAAPGEKYGTFTRGRKEERFFVATEEKQKVETYPFGPETHATIPIAVGSKEGARLHAVFLHTPDQPSS